MDARIYTICACVRACDVCVCVCVCVCVYIYVCVCGGGGARATTCVRVFAYVVCILNK